MKFLKTLFFTLALICCGAFCTLPDAQAEGVEYGVYITPKLNWSFYTGDYIDGPGVNRTQSGTNSLGGGVALGFDSWYKLDIPVRAELEFIMRGDANFNANETNVKAKAPKTAFANFYLDYHNSTDFIPYATGGVGMAFIDDKSNFAWNAGLGTRYSITENVALDFSIRYIDFGRYDLGEYDAALSSIDTTLGLSYTF